MSFPVLFLVSGFASCGGLWIDTLFEGCCVLVVLFLVIIIRALFLTILDVVIVIISAIWS